MEAIDDTRGPSDGDGYSKGFGGGKGPSLPKGVEPTPMTQPPPAEAAADNDSDAGGSAQDLADSDRVAAQYEMGAQWASELEARQLIEEEMKKDEKKDEKKRARGAAPLLHATPKAKVSGSE